MRMQFTVALMVFLFDRLCVLLPVLQGLVRGAAMHVSRCLPTISRTDCGALLLSTASLAPHVPHARLGTLS